MSFRLPTFNLLCRIWHNYDWTVTQAPPSSAPDLTSPCNLALGLRYAQLGINEDNAQALWCLLPPCTDVRDWAAYVQPWPLVTLTDTIECPAGSGRFYAVSCVEDIGLGFPNEHRFAQCIPPAQWYNGSLTTYTRPIPWPCGANPMPPPPLAGPSGIVGPSASSTSFMVAAPSGSLVCMSTFCVQSTPGIVAPAVSTTNVGTIPPAFSTGGPSSGTYTSIVGIYNWIMAGSTDSVLIVPANSGIIAYSVVYSLGTVGIRASGGAGGLVSPMSCSTTSPAVAGDGGFSAYGSIGSAGNALWTGPWVKSPNSDLVMAAGPGAWTLTTAYRTSLPAGILSSSASVGTSIPFAYQGYVEAVH